MKYKRSLALVVAIACCSLCDTISVAQQLAWDDLHAEAVRLSNAGRHKQAAEQDEKALALADAGHESNDTQRAAVSLISLGRSYQAIGRFALAEQRFTRALSVCEKELGPDHQSVAMVLGNLAEVFRAQGHPERGVPLCQRALGIWEKMYGPEHQYAAVGLNNLAEMYKAQNLYTNALPLYQRAQEILEKALGPDHVDLASVLKNQAMVYDSQNLDAQAEPFIRRALAINEKALGPDHPEVLACLMFLSRCCGKLGKDEEAEQLFQRALASRQKAVGAEHPDIAQFLYDRGGVYFLQKQYKSAEQPLLRALAIREKLWGPDHPEVLKCLEALANIYCKQEQYAQAEPLLLRALESREKKLGAEHPNVVISLDLLAKVYEGQEQDAKLEALFIRALAIKEKTLGPDHPDVAGRAYNLAKLYINLGRYSLAEPLVRRTLTIHEKCFGEESKEVAESLDTLAELYRKQSRYALAEPLCKRALSIREKIFGMDHEDVATSLNSLALVYHYQGQYALAEPLYRRVLSICEKTKGLGHADSAYSLNNLAGIYVEQGLFAQAESLFKQALATGENSQVLNNLAEVYMNQERYSLAEPLLLRGLALLEKKLGPDSPDLSVGLCNLADLYNRQKKYSQVEPLLTRALANTEKAFGPNHPNMAQNWKLLGDFYAEQDQFDKAEAAYLHALTIREKAPGSIHPDTAVTLNSLALLKSKQSRPREALKLRQRANAIVEQSIEQVFSFSSETERFVYLNTLESQRNEFLSVCSEVPGPEGAEAGLSFLLHRKGLVLDSLVEESEAARLSGDPALKAVTTELRENRSRLAALVLAGPSQTDSERYQDKVQKTRARSEELEKELARKSARFRTMRTSLKCDLPAIAAALPQGSALVEYAKFKKHAFAEKGSNSHAQAEVYVAYVLRQGEKSPVLVHLGDAKALDRLISASRASIQGLVQRQAKIADVNAASEALEQVVWAPVKSVMGTAKRVYLSPDGELNFVSFAALRGKSGRYALEDYDLAYVSSGRDLARGVSEGVKPAQKAVLFGAPDFGGAAKELDQDMITRSGGFRSELVTVRAFSGVSFEPLPGTRAEVKEIESLATRINLRSETHLGRDASEELVKATERPKILHLATHGFFLPESAGAPVVQGGGAVLNVSPGTIKEAPAAGLIKWKLENPMHRSGLALAGANLMLAGKAEPGREDGILTAEEVAGLDLAGTDLVVLSACETGLGEAKGGEGVLGLRRALVQAGAANLVMALWQVPDAATQKLMTQLYQNYLGGQPVWKALLMAQREALAATRKAGGDPNPYLWAGFVANGVGVQ